jgi:hypothetical protein
VKSKLRPQKSGCLFLLYLNVELRADKVGERSNCPLRTASGTLPMESVSTNDLHVEKSADLRDRCDSHSVPTTKKHVLSDTQ